MNAIYLLLKLKELHNRLITFIVTVIIQMLIDKCIYSEMFINYFKNPDKILIIQCTKL